MRHLKNNMAMVVLLASSLFSLQTSAQDIDVIDVFDTRLSLGLTPSEEAEFLAEMRGMLASVQGIITGVGRGDRELIAKSARYSGNRMARNTPESVRNKLPDAFKAIGGPTHMMFEELAVRAETDDMDTLSEFAGDLMNQCLSCHEQFKVN